MPSSDHPPFVVTRGDRRSLEFTPGDMQSEMSLSKPTALVLEYTRAMMGFVLFVPRPRHIVMVGLGGGSLAKFCYRVFPHTRITVIEVRADVIALRTQFAIPPDDDRFHVIHADAVDYLAAAAADGLADVLILDGFDMRGLPPALGSASFYASCRRALADGGVLVTNMFNYDPQWQAMLARLEQAFDAQVCWFDDIAGNNHVIYALHGVQRSRRLARIRRRHGAGYGLLHRIMARLLVAWLARRAVGYAPQAR